MFDFLGVIHAFDEWGKVTRAAMKRAREQRKRAKQSRLERHKTARNRFKPITKPVKIKCCCRTGGQIGRKR